MLPNNHILRMITIVRKSYPRSNREIIHRKTVRITPLYTREKEVIHLSDSLTTTTNYI